MDDAAPLDKNVPLLAPSGIAAKPFGYQTTEGMPSSLADAVPPGPISEAGSLGSEEDEHQTTVLQTFIHLVKGYIGVGLLSLPWAISQLGVTFGFVAVFIMSFWSSYNCWTVVRVKRYIEHQRHRVDMPTTDNCDRENGLSSDQASEAGSTSTVNTNITYPDLGEWAYGKTFQSYVRYVCVNCAECIRLKTDSSCAMLLFSPFDKSVISTMLAS